MYRLTVQSLSDGLETQFPPPDATQTGPSCLAGDVNWALVDVAAALSAA